MKLAVITVDRERQDDVVAVLDRTGVKGFSLIPGVLGRGETGAHFGKRAFPGENAMIIALVSDPELDQMQRALRELAAQFRPGQGLMAFGIEAQRIL